MRTRQHLLAATSITVCLAVGACSAADPLPEKDQGTTASSTEAGDQPTPASAPCPGPDQRPTGKIAYSHLDEDGDWSLWLMDPDGSNQVCLLDTPEADVAPAWSPDGSQLVFNGGDDIYIAESDGSDITLLLAGGSATDWSPNGRTILFTVNKDGREEEPHIKTIDTDGGGLRTLIRSGDRFPYVEAPEWSPDGRNVLFLASDPGGWRDLYLMRPDGSDVRLLLRRGFDLDGGGVGWSPDGTRIAFQADRDGGCLFTVNANGKDLRRLVEGCSEGFDLTWSPDSKTILWGPADNGPGDLYSVPSSGGPTSVVEDTATSAWPAWQPS